jgi:hypothetical protein
MHVLDGNFQRARAVGAVPYHGPPRGGWLLPLAELIVGLAMVPQGLVFGGLGTLPLLAAIWNGRASFAFAGAQKLYSWAILASSLSVDGAALLCLIGGALLICRPSRLGVWFSVAGTVCYWIYMVAHLTMISALSGGLRVEMTLLDAVDYPIGLVAALVAVALYTRGPSER